MISGITGKIFTNAGTMIGFGVSAAVIYGLICWIMTPLMFLTNDTDYGKHLHFLYQISIHGCYHERKGVII
jgi:hypothetical protein